jgi:hypothetical protein
VPPAVVLDLLDRVRQRVPVVEELPLPLLGQVVADHLSLDRDRPLDELARVRALRRLRGLRVLLDQLEDPRVVGEADLDDLGQPGDVVVLGQRLQGGEVAQHTGRRVERAHEVLAGGGVHAGLAPDGRVDHAEQGRRDVHHGHARAARWRRRSRRGRWSPRRRPRRRVGAGEADLPEHVPEVGRDLQVLLRLARPGTCTAIASWPSPRGPCGRPPPSRQRLRVHDGDALALLDHRRELAEQAVPDHDVVRLVPRTGMRVGLAHSADASCVARRPRAVLPLVSTVRVATSR